VRENFDLGGLSITAVMRNSPAVNFVLHPGDEKFKVQIHFQVVQAIADILN